MKYPAEVWKQLKGKKVEEIIKALERGGFKFIEKRRAQRLYQHPDGRFVIIHFHPGKTYRPGLLKKILDATGWSISDMRKFKLIK
jgi:predicted RNA binding protein YcfA (HicA-like mRNA interferase family)